jgi:hypothetical protein
MAANAAQLRVPIMVSRPIIEVLNSHRMGRFLGFPTSAARARADTLSQRPYSSGTHLPLMTRGLILPSARDRAIIPTPIQVCPYGSSLSADRWEALLFWHRGIRLVRTPPLANAKNIFTPASLSRRVPSSKAGS